MLVAGASLLVVAPAPSYDQWSWLAWGEQVWTGDLNTLDGPSFKPLPVAVSVLLAPLGAAAPVLWVFLARGGSALATVLAFGAGRRLAGGSRPAGVLAAVGVLLCGDFLVLAAAGWSEGILLALALGGAEAWRTGRPRCAVGCGLAAALVRVETWPFLLVAGVVLWRRRPQDRPLLVAVALLVPAVWIVPELVGSGQALRSASRALVPNPGQPGLSDAPAVASLRAAVALPLWPLWIGVALAAWSAWSSSDRGSRAVLVPAAVGLAWIGLVAAMAEVGFSGEPRYALPGAALVAVSGASGLVAARRRPRGPESADHASRPVRLAGCALVILVLVAAVPRVDAPLELRSAQAYQWRLHADLAAVVAAVRTDAVVACGVPYVGPLRGPLLAHHLGVARHRIEPDLTPARPGIVFRSALHADEAPLPAVPAGFSLVARSGLWQVYAGCPTPVAMIATSPESRRTANAVEERSRRTASSSVPKPTSRFDQVVKNANVFATRAAAG